MPSAFDSPPTDTLNYLDDEDHCVMCNSRPARRCLWCQSIAYCSVDCQEKDFPTHKSLCQQIPTFPPRPSPEHVRAIFFPETEHRPQLTWVECESGVDGFNGTNWTKLLADPYVGYGVPKKGRVRIQDNPMRSQTFGKGFEPSSPQRDGHCITMLYCASGNPCPNESITTSLGQPGAGESPMRGPVLAVRERPGKVYEDIALSDFRNIVDYFINHLSSLQASCIVAAPTPGPVGPLHGIKIPCWGQAQHNAGVRFEDFITWENMV